MYAPVIRSARTRKRYKFGPYEAAFLDQIVAEGSIEYDFIIVVFEEKATDPFLLVTSERNDPGADAQLLQDLGLDPDMMADENGATHFLCLFDEQGHQNFAGSSDWGDADKFEAAALRILTQRLGGTPMAV